MMLVALGTALFVLTCVSVALVEHIKRWEDLW
jgi:hypothetical protein